MNERTFHSSKAHRLDDPDRLKSLPPRDVVALLPLNQGATVADVGAGTGYFTLPLGTAVGRNGKVFAVDFQKEMLSLIREKLQAPEAPFNIQLVEGEAARTTLVAGTCDLVFMANIWHELDDHPAVTKEASRILRPDGILAIVDWRLDRPSPPGPPAGHRVSEEQVKSTLSSNGWSVVKSTHIGQDSYLLLASPARQ